MPDVAGIEISLTAGLPPCPPPGALGYNAQLSPLSPDLPT